MGFDTVCVPCCAVRVNPNYVVPDPPCNWGAVEYYEITISKAEGLYAADEGIFMQNSCNAYVEITYPDPANQYRYTPVVGFVKNEAVRTPTLKGTTDPEFKYVAQIRLGPCTPRELWMIVHHESDGWICSTDEVLGGCKLDLVACLDKGPQSLPVKKLPGTFYDESGRIHVEVRRSDIWAPAGLEILICRAWNVPQKDALAHCDTYVHVEVFNEVGECEGQTKSRVILNERNPVWDDAVPLQSTNSRRDLKPENWNIKTARIKFSVYNSDQMGGWDDFVGECALSLEDFIERPFSKLLLCDRAGDPVVDTAVPHMPCELVVGIVEATMPAPWPKPKREEKWTPETYPKHIFMMTRGTRGDVQPFVGLARGMAEMYGWLITICTEWNWKSFVESQATVSRGKIRFRCSGGDTEATMSKAISQWALSWRSEFMQMMIMANSESNFYPSCTVFMSHVLEMDNEPKPVDLIVFSLTLTGLAALVGERCKKPIAGFILQPSCIPSNDEDWTAVQPIDSHGFSWIDRFEERHFTSHHTLQTLKSMTEHSRFNPMCNITSLRSWFNLESAEAYDIMSYFKTPLVIPMRRNTFAEPHDWSRRFNVCMTNFIFLRPPKQLSAGGLLSAFMGTQSPSTLLGKSVGGFIERAQAEGRKLGLMTFSSMPAPLATVQTCCLKMVEECTTSKLSMIFVGKKHGAGVTDDLETKLQAAKDDGRYLEVDRADFGVLFQYIDLFIVQGGLGTTVEALRRKKPILVSGILLLDQRWWGSTVHAKGVGPQPVHIDNLEDHCVDFANNALDPSDPKKWRANAKNSDWGDEDDDGVKTNVDCFASLLNGDRLKPIEVPALFDQCLDLDHATVDDASLDKESERVF